MHAFLLVTGVVFFLILLFFVPLFFNIYLKKQDYQSMEPCQSSIRWVRGHF
jgi:hypothetical protein